MSDRSLKATETGINLARIALTDKKLTQEKLSLDLGITRSTVSNFFAGKRVDRQIFVTICEKLEINWQEIYGQLLSSSVKESGAKEIDIEGLVKLARKQCAADILKRCGTMQILTMPQEIGLGEIYTDVKLFDRVLGKRFLTEKEYLAELDPTDWEQTGFAGLELCKDRLDGLEVVSQFLRLMVLGRPGAGKTTFLKHLAILCNAGKFEPERVPIFVTLQDYARNEESLESFIRRKWNDDCGISDPLVLKDILGSGQALILLDGLDEVLESRRLDVIRAIENLAGAYDQARIVVTCRIAAKEYIFPKFREVQVAEFDEEQIQSFVSKWFEQDKERISKFFAKLEERPRIKHQAPNPLLLTFLCLIFEDRNDFYENRALLYEKGIDLLMERWDSSREKERDEVYKGLSTQRKEEMLSLLAFETFKEELLLFSRDRAANSIATYIKDLRDVIGDREALLANGRKIVTSIESQHGLLTERFDGVYSFSHLTFHEYFTAYEIVRVQQSSPEILEELVSHLFNKKWREVFLLTVEMSPQRTANQLLLNMKSAIDNLLAEDEKLQSFLRWVDDKSLSIKDSYKSVAIRAYYFAIDRDYGYEFDISCALDNDFKNDYDFDSELALYPHEYSIDPNLALDISLILTLDRAIDPSLDLDPHLDLHPSFLIAKEVGCHRLCQRIQTLKDKFPKNWEDLNYEDYKIWWDLNEKKWIKEYHQAIIENRNIKLDWNFTGMQREKLRQYYEVNELLVECLNSDCNVSLEVRQKIENTLLLPLLHPDNQT